jgi:GT2 family glycosyltransferase
MSIPVLIIPVLNRYDLLDQNINSIDHPIDEICIINNGLEEYTPTRTDLNIKVFKMPSNQGIAGSWNLGIKFYPHKPYWLISSADNSFISGSLALIEELASPDKLLMAEESFGTFAIGENVIKTVGLFDEYIYPAYYEDTQYKDRIHQAGMDHCMDHRLDIRMNWNGGSNTIKSDPKLNAINGETFRRNEIYYKEQQANNFFFNKGWDLTRRRENEWLRG